MPADKDDADMYTKIVEREEIDESEDICESRDIASTTIADIPNELMSYIFEFLKPTAKDLNILMLVSKHWKALADTSICWRYLADSYKEKNPDMRAYEKKSYIDDKYFYFRLTGHITLFSKPLTRTDNLGTVSVFCKETDTIKTVRYRVAEAYKIPKTDIGYLRLLHRVPLSLNATVSESKLSLENTVFLYGSSYHVI